jgi:hypothetical protein
VASLTSRTPEAPPLPSTGLDVVARTSSCWLLPCVERVQWKYQDKLCIPRTLRPSSATTSVLRVAHLAVSASRHRITQSTAKEPEQRCRAPQELPKLPRAPTGSRRRFRVWDKLSWQSRVGCWGTPPRRRRRWWGHLGDCPCRTGFILKSECERTSRKEEGEFVRVGRDTVPDNGELPQRWGCVHGWWCCFCHIWQDIVFAFICRFTLVLSFHDQVPPLHYTAALPLYSDAAFS